MRNDLPVTGLVCLNYLCICSAMQTVSEHRDNNEVDDERDRDGDGGLDGSVEVCLVHLGGI